MRIPETEMQISYSWSTAVEDRMQQARTSIDADPNVRAMKDIFGATVQPESVRPVDNS